MARTTATLVKDVLGSEYDGQKSLTPYVRWANLVTSRVYTCAYDRGVTLSDSELTEIETWLAAHAYQQADPGYQSRSENGASGSFRGQTGMYLESTLFGQTAVMLDNSGCLKAIGSGSAVYATGEWLGLPPSEQTPYYERD